MAPGGNIIVKTHDGLEVKARQRLNTDAAFNDFMTNFMEKLNAPVSGENVIVSDLDLSQNKLTLEQWSQITTALSTVNARVLRFRLFGSASLNDDVMVHIADYLAGLTEKEAPTEMHLSDCAITTAGFAYFMEKIESVDYLPLKSGAGGRSTPLYLRIENNYIEEEAIKDKVDAGVIKTFTKKEGRPSGDKGAKINMLVSTPGRYQQKSGSPPAPEDAPAPKHINDLNSRGQWSAGGGAQARTGSQNWRPSGGQQQWPAVSRTVATQRWSAPAATQKPGVTPINRYGNKNIMPTSSRTGTQYAAGHRSSTVASGGANRGFGFNQGSVDRSRTPMGRGGNGMAATRGSVGKGGTKGAGKGKGGGASKLPPGWEEHHSTDYDIPYYWNSETGASVWERPTA